MKPGRSWRWWERWCSTRLVDNNRWVWIILNIQRHIYDVLASPSKVLAYQWGWRRGRCRRSGRNHGEARCFSHIPSQTYPALDRSCPYREPEITTAFIINMVASGHLVVLQRFNKKSRLWGKDFSNCLGSYSWTGREGGEGTCVLQESKIPEKDNLEKNNHRCESSRGS